ncbi:MAG: M12 family metallopeptidase [Trueperaceae bacterium]|nr:M12 family metallopeptidase [Trueperaceae bacterium]
MVQDEYLAGPAGEPVELLVHVPGEDQATELTAELVEGVVLIEGDIALGTYDELTAMGELTPHSHGIATSYWPASTATPPYVYEIPYVVSDDFSQSYRDDVIEPAIEHWNESTAIEFVPRNGEADYVEFVTVNSRCWSAVGRQVGRQEIRLDENACTRIATVVHELGHTVGLKHEQQRTDRDDFVEIVWDNIRTNPDRSGNFRLFGPGLPLGEYGYTSIMHYSRTAFGKVDANGNRMTTIRTLGPTIQPANRLTDGDLAGIRRLYPEEDLPFADITEPEATVTVDEGDTVTFAADAVIDPALDDRDLLLHLDVRPGWRAVHLRVERAGPIVLAPLLRRRARRDRVRDLCPARASWRPTRFASSWAIWA